MRTIRLKIADRYGFEPSISMLTSETKRRIDVCLDPQTGDRILDPACGTCGFLVSAYRHILAVRALLPRFEAKIQRVLDRVWDGTPEVVRMDAAP